MQHRFLIAAALTACVLLAACGGGTATPTTSATSASTLVIPTNLPVATSTLAHGGTPEILAQPDDLTGYEIIASNAGEAVYSGYTCTIISAGCACETPVLLRGQFIFKGGQRMDYRFVVGGQETVWEFTDIGPSHWEYTLNYQYAETELTGTHKVWLEFTDTGFIRTEFARLIDDTLITCPDVTYRRIAMPTDEPSPAASATP